MITWQSAKNNKEIEDIDKKYLYPYETENWNIWKGELFKELIPTEKTIYENIRQAYYSINRFNYFLFVEIGKEPPPINKNPEVVIQNILKNLQVGDLTEEHKYIEDLISTAISGLDYLKEKSIDRQSKIFF